MKKPVRPPDGDEAEFCDTTPPHAIPRTRARAPADDWPDDYLEQFDADYPHKVGMAAALTALTSKRRELAGRVPWWVIVTAIADYAGRDDPKTWIERERWNDRPEAGSAPSTSPSPDQKS